MEPTLRLPRPRMFSAKVLTFRVADDTGPRKLHHRIVPTTRLRIPRYIREGQHQAEYHLCSGICHIGHCTNTGHYRAFGYGKPDDSSQIITDLESLQTHLQRGAVHPALHVHDDNRIGAIANVAEINDICCNRYLLFYRRVLLCTADESRIFVVRRAVRPLPKGLCCARSSADTAQAVK